MGFIYKITNLINNQSYIGLTTRLVETRWKEHLRGSQYIDNIIQEVGKENFTIETLEECDDQTIDDREIYWINYYDTFKNGYNQTAGGRDNRMIMTDKVEEVLSLWNEGLTVNRIIEITHLNVETVRGYLNKNNISHEMIKSRANIFIGAAKAKPIGQYDKNNNLIKLWPSQAEIRRQLKYAKSTLQKAVSKEKLLDEYYWRKV